MKTQSLAILLSGAWTHWGAFAHEGHGIAGSAHWHASDVLGIAGLALVAAALWYMGRNR